MKLTSTILLCAAVLLTLWMIKADQAVPGNYTRWGELNMIQVWTLVAVRWLALTIAFTLLLASGKLNAWVPIGFFRVALVIGGIFLLEVLAAGLHHSSVSEKIKPQFHLVFAILATLLPAFVIASGFLNSRALFLIGVGGALLTFFVPTGETSFLVVKHPFLNLPADAEIGSFLPWADPMYGQGKVNEVLAQIEKRPHWTDEVAGKLDDPMYGSSAMYVLCRRPSGLSEELQERCWIAVGATTGKLDKQLREMGHAMLSDAHKLREAVLGLAAFESPVREKHRGEIAAAREVLARVHADSPSFPELDAPEPAGAGGGSAGASVVEPLAK